MFTKSNVEEETQARERKKKITIQKALHTHKKEAIPIAPNLTSNSLSLIVEVVQCLDVAIALAWTSHTRAMTFSIISFASNGIS